MFRKNLESIADVSIYPVISLLIFFIFFSVLIAYLVKTDKSYMDELSQIPLNNSETENE